MSLLLHLPQDVLARLKSDPTIPATVPTLLDALLLSIQQMLGQNLVGLYLRGSLAMGDFDPLASDVDFFAVTEHLLTEAEFTDLTTMHDTLARLPNPYAVHLEGAYIPRVSVRRFTLGERLPTLYRQERLRWFEHDYNWVLERRVVREHGLTLYGPAPTTLIDPVSTNELREAVRSRMPEWLRWANQADDPDWQLHLGQKAYVIQTMCRALCTLATGTLPSKPQAVAWALATLPEPWRSTVVRSQAWHGKQTFDVSLNPEIQRFIRMAASQA
ncbi:aminoglycoside adenylyltransferase domain-containing protein [Ktedonobacter racemifer]|uniref:DNA polymerase beta domain protein region n=1 Tax=Ktedonobacter racemifer DSM 44963 TaxID=485913 RepID=D6U126_KTERA|nr:aminoglycoside adenylyltransferase domain-containing protein [Ktedonobacter racemifer]EFH82516.1 DNA polymerase beta domain protein region [Ktedonobacter racemifer DSM 44963]